MLFVTTLLFLNPLPPIEVEELKGLIDNVVIRITKGEKQINKGEVHVFFQKEYMLICIITLKMFKSYNIPCILSLLEQKKLTKMNARDLVRILEIETSFNKLCYTVSLVQSIERFSERHLSVSFSSRNFMESLTTQFGLGCQFEQIILDYFWIPTGIWQKEHWTKAFFNKTLVEFATKDILIPHGVIYLSFTVHCLCEIALEYDILNQLYMIGWVDKTNLAQNILWKATNKIDANVMFAFFEKQLNQEDIYCKISKQMFEEDLSGKD